MKVMMFIFHELWALCKYLLVGVLVLLCAVLIFVLLDYFIFRHLSLTWCTCAEMRSYLGRSMGLGFLGPLSVRHLHLKWYKNFAWWFAFSAASMVGFFVYGWWRNLML